MDDNTDGLIKMRNVNLNTTGGNDLSYNMNNPNTNSI